MVNPISDLLFYLQKTGAKKPVRSYLRLREGRPELVREHEREMAEGELEDEPPPELIQKKQNEIELWKRWKAGGERPEDLRPLLKSFSPLIQSRASVFKQGNLRVSPAAIDAEFYKQALNAFQTYDPSKGASLGTHLWQRLEKAKRFIYANQNVARIPEHRITKIREFQAAEEALEAQLGRPASDAEMAGYLKWPIKEIARMATEIRRDLFSHSEQWEEDPTRHQASKEEQLLKFIRYELSEEERQVYDLFVGKGMTSTTEIAKKTGFDIYKVSRLKKAIGQKIERYMK